MAGTITLTVDGGTALTPLSLSIDPGALTLAGQTVTASTNTFDYYIGPSGDNTDAGTVAEPWNISALWLKTEVIGRRIGLLSGTYTLSTSYGSYDVTEQCYIRIQGGIDADEHTHVESVVPRGAVFTGGNSALHYIYAFVVPSTEQFVTLKNVKITEAAGGIRVRGQDVLVEGCEVTQIYDDVSGNPVGALNVGVATDRVTFRNCLVDTVENGVPGSANAGGLGPVYISQNVIVEYCTFKNVPAGVDLKRDYGGYTIRNNFFESCDCAIRCALMADTDAYLPNEIHNNLVFGSQGGAFTNGPVESGVVPVTTDVYNNTVILKDGTYSDHGPFILQNDNGATDTGSGAFYNNIVYYPTSESVGQGIIYTLNRTNNALQRWIGRLDYNAYGISSSKFTMYDVNQQFTSLSSWRTYLDGTSIAGKEAGSIVGDPLFVDASGTTPADFQLQSGSPCKDAGKVGGVSAGASTDMGCWGNGATQVGADF